MITSQTVTVKYNEALQEKLEKFGAKTEAQPWLHCIMGEYAELGKEWFVANIFVWDTREIIETVVYRIQSSQDFRKVNSMIMDTTNKFRKYNGIQLARDNNEPFTGKNAEQMSYLMNMNNHVNLLKRKEAITKLK